MMTEDLIQRLRTLGLNGMADSLLRQLQSPEQDTLLFEERMNLMIQNECVERANYTFQKRLRIANLPIRDACLEGIDLSLPRALDTSTLASVCEMGWIKRRLNVIITGPCGIGKSYIASALAHAACRADHSVRCFKMPQFAAQLRPGPRPAASLSVLAPTRQH